MRIRVAVHCLAISLCCAVGGCGLLKGSGRTEVRNILQPANCSSGQVPSKRTPSNDTIAVGETGDSPVRLTQFESLVPSGEGLVVNSHGPLELLQPPDAGLAGSDTAKPRGPIASRTIKDALDSREVEHQDASDQLTYDLDLSSALAMAGADNPEVAYAAARYREAYARLVAAKRLWLPSIHAGVSYNHHEGTLQETQGGVPVVSRSSLHAGLGVRGVGAGTPAVPGILMHVGAADAIFQPKIAAHAASARNAASQQARNDTLLATALAYLDLLQAVQQIRIAEETRDNAEQLADLTARFASSGQGPQADADRAKAELVKRRNDVLRAGEAVKVASARLAELLRLEPTADVVPKEPAIVPVELVPLDLPLPELLATGLSGRPELSEVKHLACEAAYRYRREKYAPILPRVLLGISDSGFGGGQGSAVDNFRNRFDFDVAAYWEIRNLGLGEGPRRDETRARYDQARLRQVQVMDEIAREIVQAHTQIEARYGQIAVAESGIEAATDSYRRNLERIREGEGLPIEVLQSMQALDESRREYLNTLVDYNAAQFRLQHALEWAIQ